MENKTFSSTEAAALLGISARQLYRQLYSGLIPEPEIVYLKGSKLRLWSREHLAKAMQARLEARIKRSRAAQGA